MARTASGKTPRSGTRTRAAAPRKGAGKSTPVRMEGESSFGSRMERDEEIKVATPAQIAICVNRVIEANAVVGRAMGRVGALYDEIEADFGLSRDAIKEAIREGKLNQSQAMRRHAEKTRVKVALGILPPPADDRWTTAVSQVEMEFGVARGEPAEQLDYTMAYQQGFKAGVRNKAANMNPYNEATDSKRAVAWKAGQVDGLKERKILKPETKDNVQASPSRERPTTPDVGLLPPGSKGGGLETASAAGSA